MEQVEEFWDYLCCASEDHTIREGGSHINVVQLKKLAKWPFLASINYEIPESMFYPLANAIVCDRCLGEKREIKYAVAGEREEDGKGARFYRVPIDELEEPAVYWPDLHPDNKPLDAR